MAVVVAILVFTNNLQSAVFTLGTKKVDLPINPQWLSKAPSKDGLVFFDPQSPAPRLFINYYRTSFFYPNDDQRKFEVAFNQNKQGWIKSIEGREIIPPNFRYDPQSKKVTNEYVYSANSENFRELVVMQECGGGESVALKVLIPSKVNYDSTPLTTLATICPQ